MENIQHWKDISIREKIGLCLSVFFAIGGFGLIFLAALVPISFPWQGVIMVLGMVMMFIGSTLGMSFYLDSKWITIELPVKNGKSLITRKKTEKEIIDENI